MNTYFRIWLLLALCTLAVAGCVQRQAGSRAANFETIQSEVVRVDVTPDAPSRVYVSLRDKTDKIFGLRALMEAHITGLGYEVTNNPSRAGYILQVDVVAAGTVDAQAVRLAVQGGYGAPLSFSGQGAEAVVVDVLLALRNKPQALKKRSHVLRAASSRSAVASYQMRAATISHDTKIPFSAEVRLFEDPLVKIIGEMLPPLPAQQ